jgi:hypothetical protein
MVAGAAQIGDGAPSTPPPSPAATAPAPSAKDPDKVVCRYIVPTGQRLGGQKVCHTNAEWADINRSAKDQTNDMQAHGLEGGVPGK